METIMNYEKTITKSEVEYDLIKWAERGGEEEDHPACLRIWDLNEDQLDTIKDACACPYAAASIANAMWCITDEEGLARIAEVLRDY